MRIESDESHRDESHRDAAAKNAFQNATGPFEQTEIGESENRPVDFSTRASEAVEGQIRQDEISEDEKCERVASASQAENFTARAGEMMLSQARSRRVLCEADVKVRELQRFWREKFGENARLQLRGEDVASSLSLREFATQLFASDSDSENVQTKETPKTLEIQTDETTKNAASANVANANTDNANVANVDVANAEIVDANIIDAHVADVSAEILEARVVCGARVRAGFSVAIADAKAGDEKPLQLEIVAMNGARIEKVRLCGSEIDA